MTHDEPPEIQAGQEFHSSGHEVATKPGREPDREPTMTDMRLRLNRANRDGYTKAAALLHSLARNHALIDGNKGWACPR